MCLFTSVITPNIALNSIKTLVFVLEVDFILCYPRTKFLQIIQFSFMLFMFPMFVLCPFRLKCKRITPFSLKSNMLPFKSVLLSVSR